MSSIPLGDELAALTELSDLAPGAVFDRSDGYWTGLPAPKIGRYALMRTWLAPEMPRPGCVWTHALLLEPSVLEEVPDLAVLMGLANRPNGLQDRVRYGIPFQLDAREENLAPRSSFSDAIVRRVLSVLYASVAHSVAVPAPGAIDSLVFALWSQQWPRLRRNFRFQTAVTRGPRFSSAVRLDLELQLDTHHLSVDKADSAAWVQAAADDVMTATDGSLRSFLWRYGKDVRRQRGSFRPLVEIKLLDDSAEEDAGLKLTHLITRFFRDRMDAVRLKQDIVDGFLVPHAQLEVLSFVLVEGGHEVFPPPSKDGVARLARLWPIRPHELLGLAEATADAEDDVGKSVFDTVTSAVPVDEFWSFAASYPRVCERMVAARPNLMDSQGIDALESAALASLLQLVPGDTPPSGSVIQRLLSRDDFGLAEVAVGRFPQIVATELVSALDRSAMPGRAWLKALAERPRTLLDSTVICRATRTGTLYELAEALGWTSAGVIEAGPQPWVAALANVVDDLIEEKRDMLNSFLVALSLVTGGDGGRQLLEKLFDPVHEQVLLARLPWRAQGVLSPYLPDLGWFKSWDFGLRLRRAVAMAYVRNGYPKRSYAKLSRSPKTRVMLAEAADEVIGGEPFADAIDTR